MFAGRSLSARALARFMSINATSVKFDRFGNPASVLSIESVKVDDNLAPNAVLVKMLAASISPSDLSQIRGFGPSKTGVAGNEGLGVVQKVGSNVKGLSVSDLVVPIKPGVGTWSTYAVASADALAKVPGTEDQVPLHAAGLAAPAAAIALVDSFAGLKPGDVIIQNNAASTVGQAVVIYAASKGIKTVNIMRLRDDYEDIVNHLQGYGGSVFVTDDFASTYEFPKLIADLGAPKLGLSSVGGDAGTAVLKAVGSGGSFVVYGNMSRQAHTISLDSLLKGVTVQGFSLDRYLASLSPAQRASLLDGAVDLASKLLYAVESFSDFEIALKRSLEAGERKVVVTMF